MQAKLHEQVLCGKVREDPEDTHSGNKPAKKADKPNKPIQILWIQPPTPEMSSVWQEMW